MVLQDAEDESGAELDEELDEDGVEAEASVLWDAEDARATSSVCGLDI